MKPAQGNESNAIADILLHDGKITAEILEKARMAYVTLGVTVTDWLINENYVSREDLIRAKAKYFNVPFIKLSDLAVSPVALGYIDKEIATRLSVLPFEFNQVSRQLSVAMANPVDLSAIEFLEKKTGVSLKIFAATPNEIKENIDVRYAQSLSTEVTAALKEAGGSGNQEVKTINIRKVNELIKEAPIAKIVTTILEFAMKSRASDVHIEPLEERTRVRYRIDGILHEKLVLPKKIHDALVTSTNPCLSAENS